MQEIGKYLRREITPETIESKSDETYFARYAPLLKKDDKVWFWDNCLWGTGMGAMGYAIVFQDEIVFSEVISYDTYDAANGF